jgi:cell division protein ZapA (FtsZ GTPase activity inhibitor)
MRGVTLRPPVPIQIAGATYRVHSSASVEELSGLAAVVEQKLRELVPGDKPLPPQAFLLVAMGLAHDLREERGRRLDAERALVQEQARRPVIEAPEGAPDSPAEGSPRGRGPGGKRR